MGPIPSQPHNPTPTSTTAASPQPTQPRTFQRNPTQQEFRQLLMTWARVSGLTNMGCERLLAQIKCSAAGAGSGPPNVERLCAAGTLTQWLQQHLAARGEDPRLMSRRQVLEQGAPLLRQAKGLSKGSRATRSHRPAGAFTVFSNTKRASRVTRGERLSKSAAKLEREALVEEWKTMSVSDKRYYSNVGAAEYDRAEIRRLTADMVDDNPTKAYNPGILWGLGTKTMPISEENFTRCARAAWGDDEQLCGSHKYCAALREKLRASVFVKDEGVLGSQNIAPAMPITATRPTSPPHPPSPYRPPYPPSPAVLFPR